MELLGRLQPGGPGDGGRLPGGQATTVEADLRRVACGKQRLGDLNREWGGGGAGGQRREQRDAGDADGGEEEDSAQHGGESSAAQLDRDGDDAGAAGPIGDRRPGFG